MVNFKINIPHYFQGRGQCCLLHLFWEECPKPSEETTFCAVSPTPPRFLPRIAFFPKKNKEYSRKTIKMLGKTTQTDTEAN